MIEKDLVITGEKALDITVEKAMGIFVDIGDFTAEAMAGVSTAEGLLITRKQIVSSPLGPRKIFLYVSSSDGSRRHMTFSPIMGNKKVEPVGC